MNEIRKSMLGVAALGCCLGAFAIPAKQGVRTILQPDGTTVNVMVSGDEFSNRFTDEQGRLLTVDADGFLRPASPAEAEALIEGARRGSPMRVPQSGLGMYTTTYPTTGSPRCLVILAEYQDVRFSEEYDVKDYFTRMMNEEGFELFGGTGSVADYFREQSGGKFTPVFDVYGPVTLPEDQKYYGDNRGQGWDVYAHYMVRHACELLDDEIDFSLYDEDNDGDVDFIYIFYAGQGAHNLGGPDSVWPHSGMLKTVADFKILDGKWLNLYACSNELEGDLQTGIGNFVHEYSHVLGLPDLYTTASDAPANRDFTVGRYSVLDYGVYNNDARTPPNFTAYERNALQWDEPVVLEGAATVTLDDISTGKFCLIPTSDSNEFFLLENRQLKGWDAWLPNHGLLVWHIDYDKKAFSNNEVNVKRDHQCVAILKANNEEGFMLHSEGFTYPGTSGKTSITAETEPALLSWKGEDPGLPVTDIHEESGYVIFDVAGGVHEDVDTGIAGVTAPDNTPEYYTLQGGRILRPEPGMMVLERRGSAVRKVVI